LARSSRKRRKARQRPARAERATSPRAGGAPTAGRSRSAEKDAAARAALEPLREGERPLAMTIGAIVALSLAVANLTSYVAGVEIRGDRPAFAGVAAYTLLMLVAAWGMWRARYWAVLGMQALLALLLIIFSVLAVTASSVPTVLISLAVIGSAGTLFWFLVKAMARIQMPTKP
jgi:cation transport ATPase